MVLAAISIPLSLFSSGFTFKETSPTKVSSEISAISQNKSWGVLTVLVKKGNQMEKIVLTNNDCRFLIKEKNIPDTLETITVKRETTRLIFPFIFNGESKSYNIYLSEEQVIQHRL
jgi:hypothetical protein